MTTILAYHDTTGDRVWLAADTKYTGSDGRSVLGQSKVFLVADDVYCAYYGGASLRTAIMQYAALEEDDAVEPVLSFETDWLWVHNFASQLPAAEDSGLVVITPFGIYRVAWDASDAVEGEAQTFVLDVMRVEDEHGDFVLYGAGSGGDYAAGAMHALVCNASDGEDAENLLKRSLAVAELYDAHTGGGQHVVSVRTADPSKGRTESIPFVPPRAGRESGGGES